MTDSYRIRRFAVSYILFKIQTRSVVSPSSLGIGSPSPTNHDTSLSLSAIARARAASAGFSASAAAARRHFSGSVCPLSTYGSSVPSASSSSERLSLSRVCVCVVWPAARTPYILPPPNTCTVRACSQYPRVLLRKVYSRVQPCVRK